MDTAVQGVMFRIKEAKSSLNQTLDILSVLYGPGKVGPETSRIVNEAIVSLKHITTGNYFWS